MTDKKENKRRIKTPPFRLSFPVLLEPKAGNMGGAPKYSMTMLFPPGFDRRPFDAAFKEAMIEKYGADTGKWPRLKRKPNDVLRSFEEYNAEANKPLEGDWKGWTMARANASEKYPPGVVGPTKGSNGKFPVVTDGREIYGGRWAKAVLEAYVYDRQDGKGVTLGISNVQLLKHDGKFGGAVTAPEDDFDDASPEWAGEADAFDNGAAPAEDAGW